MSWALLPSFRRQQLLLEFAALKSHCPEGLYLAPSASNALTWSGVLFVRSGPYASAIVRFEITFPPTYPDVAPQITCSTELFHPLLTPLTTYTLAGRGLDPSTPTSAPTTSLSTPGSFSLRHGFPGWFVQSNESSRVSSTSVRDRDEHSSNAARHQLGCEQDQYSPDAKPSNILPVLVYFKRAFEDYEFLDTLPYAAAANMNAWHAWRTHRGLPRVGSRSVSPASTESSKTPSSLAKQPADWKWDGVWQSRVESGVEESIGDAALYSTHANRTTIAPDGVRFVKIDDEKVAEIQCSMLRAFGIEAAHLQSSG